jgi:cell wall-associated NlpC family hydrolase
MTEQQAILTAAQAMDGDQYWSEACAHAVSDVLREAHLAALLPPNPYWVPSWASWGDKVAYADLQPGDIVIYNWEPGEVPNPVEGGAGYDHIGVYAGNGHAYNVSSANNHQFVPTPLVETFFQEARRPHV